MALRGIEALFIKGICSIMVTYIIGLLLNLNFLYICIQKLFVYKA